MSWADLKETKLILWCDRKGRPSVSGWVDILAAAEKRNAHAIIVNLEVVDPGEAFPCPVKSCKGVCRARPKE